MDNQVLIILNKNKSVYSKKLKEFTKWATTRSEMNGSSTKYIKNMISQILKELHIPQSKHVSIVNTLYRKDYDASSIVNKICSFSEEIFDIVHKDNIIVTNTAQNYYNALNECGIKLSSYTSQQIVGLVIFVQFILLSGRNELEGFGISTDLVDKRKKIVNLKEKKKKEEKIKERQLLEEKSQKEEKLQKENEKKLEKIKLVDEIPDSWEDL